MINVINEKQRLILNKPLCLKMLMVAPESLQPSTSDVWLKASDTMSVFSSAKVGRNMELVAKPMGHSRASSFPTNSATSFSRSLCPSHIPENKRVTPRLRARRNQEFYSGAHEYERLTKFFCAACERQSVLVNGAANRFEERASVVSKTEVVVRSHVDRRGRRRIHPERKFRATLFTQFSTNQVIFLFKNIWRKAACI